MSQTVKVLSIGEVRIVGANATKVVDVEVLKLDTKDTLKVSCFLGKGEASELKIGFDYEADMEGKDYKGKKQYSMPLWTMKEMPKIDPEKEEGEVTQEMWDQKERRGHRRACLAIASSLLADDIKKELGKPEGDVVGMVQLMATKLLDYVYEEINIPL